MKKSIYILTILTLAAFTHAELPAQEVNVRIDSTGLKKKTGSAVSQKQEQNRSQAQERLSNQAKENQGGTVRNQARNQSQAPGQVKQVKGARPDMSKAAGARPPVITRPAGSGIPKGIGKPGGAMRRGGR